MAPGSRGLRLSAAGTSSSMIRPAGPAARDVHELDAERPARFAARRRCAHGRRASEGPTATIGSVAARRSRRRRRRGGPARRPPRSRRAPPRPARSLLRSTKILSTVPSARRRDLDRRLVRLHLDQRMILRDCVALLHEPARDLRLGQPLAEIGELELVGHGGAGYCEVAAVAPQLIGREDELVTIARLLEAPASASAQRSCSTAIRDRQDRALAGRGRSGAGRGYRVLSSRPSEAETRLSYTGLTDLLGDVVDDVLPALPAPQRRALEAALLLAEPDAGTDERAVAAAFLSSLRALVGGRAALPRRRRRPVARRGRRRPA